MLRSKPSDAADFLFLCAVAFSFVNYSFYGFRISDVFLISLIPFLAVCRVKSKVLIFSALFFFSILISDVSFLFSFDDYDLGKAVFYYKYLVIFLVIVFSVRFFEVPGNFILYCKVSVPLVFVLVFWVLLSHVTEGRLDGNSRPSFPFSNDYSRSDAHLYSAILGMCFIFYFFIMRGVFNAGVALDVVAFFGLLIALVLTGSRSGIAAILCFVLLWGGIHILRVLFIRRISYFVAVGFLCSCFVFCLFLVAAFGLDGVRSFNFDLAADESSLGRVGMFFSALNQAIDSPFFLGRGAIGAEHLFYDGIITTMLAHGGFFMAILFVVLAVFIFLGCLRSPLPFNCRAILASFVGVFVFLNLITEYVLVTRGAVVMISMIAFAWCKIHHSLGFSRLAIDKG